MTDAEEKARTYAQLETLRTDKLQVGSTTVSINNIGNIGAFRAGCERGYLAGYAEAMRWRKCSDELPGKSDYYDCYRPRSRSIASEMFKVGGGFPEEYSHWRPIGPLPQGEK